MEIYCCRAVFASSVRLNLGGSFQNDCGRKKLKYKFEGKRNGGACEECKSAPAGCRGTKKKKYWRRKKRKEQKTRAVASLETRIRVVVSIEVRSTPRGRECYICEWLYGPCVASYDLKLKRLGSPYSKDFDAVLPCFAKLAMGCSNPSLKFFVTLSFFFLRCRFRLFENIKSISKFGGGLGPYRPPYAELERRIVR